MLAIEMVDLLLNLKILMIPSLKEHILTMKPAVSSARNLDILNSILLGVLNKDHTTILIMFIL